MANKRIIDLDAGSVDQHSWFEQADTANGKSEKVSADDISDYVGISANFSSLTTTAKGLVGAVNEVNAKTGKVLSDTLEAGSSSIVFTDNAIVASSLISVYADVWYSSIVTDGVNHTCTITFPAQSSAMDVSIEIK